MTQMGRYCKAYPIKKLRAFSQWTEKAENARKEKQKGAKGKELEVARVLTDNNFLYLQENYAVTDGIYKDENIIFDQVTPEWIAYCHQVLQFETPSFVSTPQEPADSKG